MKQDDKDLLLRDLCARLPYGVKCQFEDRFLFVDGETNPYYDYVLSERHIELFRRHKGFYIKPYLRPMSSMTKDEFKEFMTTWEALEHRLDVTVPTIESYDWFNEHHFDYREIKNEKGDRKTMIDLGLALPAPEGMYNF